MSMDIIRQVAHDHSMSIFSAREWTRLHDFAQTDRAVAATVELAGGAVFYVYADGYTFATGLADDLMGARELMVATGKTLIFGKSE